MTPFERITYTRAAYHVEWLCMQQGSALAAWLNLMRALYPHADDAGLIADAVARHAQKDEPC